MLPVGISVRWRLYDGRMSCRLCNRQRKMMKSHIVPEAFWHVLRVEAELPPVLIRGVEGVFQKKAPIGVYDQGILCDECEPKFQAVDDYGVQVLLRDFDRLFTPITDTTFPPRVVGYESNLVDQDLLLRFLVSVLWRASVSTQDIYQHVRLGDLEAQAAQAIDLRVPVPPTFGAVVARFTAAGELGYATHAILDPRPTTLQGVPVYVMYLGASVVYLKAGDLPFSEEFIGMRVGGGERLRVISRDFGRSSELQAMWNTVAINEERMRLAEEARQERRERAAPD